MGEDRDLGRPGGLSSCGPSRKSVSSVPASIPDAGDVFTIVYPFVRGTFLDVLNAESYEDGAPIDKPTWLPGVEYRDVSPEDTAPFADAEGRCRFTVVGAFKPGHYPMRVFFTRKFIDPDGKEFGKSRLHIATLDKFRRLVIGYRDPYGLGDQPPPRRHWSGQSLRDARAEFESLLAQAIEARRAETAQTGSVHESAVPEGCATKDIPHD